MGKYSNKCHVYKYFKTDITSIEIKPTINIKHIYFVQFAQPIPTSKYETIVEYGEYIYWPEPAMMLRIYLVHPTEIPINNHSPIPTLTPYP